MPVGKLAAQVAHASMGFLTRPLRASNQEPDPYSNEAWHTLNGGFNVPPPDRVYRSLEVDEELGLWLDNSFTKVVVAAKDEAHLLELYALAGAKNLRRSLICDEGRTVFGGVPTNTCIAIGPNWIDSVDSVTKGLPLYR